jgi:hypothetical protein
VHGDVRDKTDGWGAQAYAGQLALARKDGGGAVDRGLPGTQHSTRASELRHLGAYRKVELRSRPG